MQLAALKKLVAQGEGQRLEFKRKAAFPEKIVREVVAFANAEGGTLLVGIDDNGEIPGLKHPDDDEYVLRQAIAKHCNPPVKYDLERVKIGLNRQVLVYQIHESEAKPVFAIYNFRTGRGRAYVRVADRSIQASREMRQILQARQSPQPQGFTYGENERKLMQHLGQHGKTSVEQYAQAANLPRAEASQILVRLTLAGVLNILPQENNDDFVMKEA